jgi:hypothetical protein
MKQITNISNAPIKYFAIAAFFLSQTLIWAQETKEVDVNLSVDDGGGEWYVQPWVWIVGAAIFIIIIVALLRGNNNK